MNFLKSLKNAIVIPAVLSSIWFANLARETRAIHLLVPFEVQKLGSSAIERVHSKKTEATDPGPGTLSLLESAVIERRMRVERVLVLLDAVAEATMTMGPEQASWVEPVLEDIAERSIGLISDEALLSDQSETELLEIEESVGKLVEVIDKMVEPEMSL